MLRWRWLPDPFIVVPTIFLLVMGTATQYSIANKQNGIQVDLNLTTQLLAIGVGLGIMIALQYVRPAAHARWLKLFYLAALILLVMVQFFGVVVNGSQRWVNLGPVQIQPTEIAKLGLIVYLARMFDTREVAVNRFSTIIKSLLAAAVPAALILLQPDLGSAIVLVVIWIVMLFASRLKLSRFAFLLAALFAAVLVMIPFMAEYQQQRLVSYFNPDKDASGASYNVLQAGIAIGNGGLTGVGLDSGTQSQLNFLPSQHTDFVFAVASEKLGLIGSMGILLAFTLLIFRLSYVALKSTNQYERGICMGTSGMLFFHVFVNIGMNLGLVPVTGLPLPFLSYGGTFMVVTLMLVGLCASISRDLPKKGHVNTRG